MGPHLTLRKLLEIADLSGAPAARGVILGTSGQGGDGLVVDVTNG